MDTIRIKEIRTLKGITLKDLSQKSGISINYLKSLEKGEIIHPTIMKLTAVADALQVTPDDLFINNSIPLINLEILDTTCTSYKKTRKIPCIFTDANDARKYLEKHSICENKGIDTKNFNDKTVLEFANTILNLINLLADKYVV